LYSRRTAPAQAAAPPRILLVRVDERVGNLITLQPLIDAARQRWPEAVLGLWCSARKAEVARSLQGLDRLHLIDKRWFFSRPWRWHASVREVRAAGYSAAVDLSAWPVFSFSHAALSHYSGAPLRISFERGVDPGFSTERVLPGPPGEYELAQRLRLLAPLGLPAAAVPELRTTLGLAEALRFGRWMQEQRIGSPAVGLWVGSRKLERRWPADRYVELGLALRRELGASLVLLWGPAERALRDKVARALPGAQLAPPTGIGELAGLLRRLDLVVANDTGPMHLAVAVHTRTVALFVTDDASRWGHPLPWVRNLSGLGRDSGEMDRVLAACRELLGQNAPP
jgi:ADP-heptose:LPS heptosyltransferase